MKGPALPLERACALWRRFTLFLIRLAGLRRLWSSLGNYLQMIRQRGQPEVATQQPQADKDSSGSNQNRRRR